MNALVERLRRQANLGSDLPLGVPAALREAADEIERLQRQLDLWNPGGLPFDSRRQVRR